MMYGPFTPQECDSAVKWLDSKGVQFQIIKDEEKEKDFRRSDGQNLVNQAHWRTEVFLAQVFYVEIESWSSSDQAEFTDKFLQKQEVPPDFIRQSQESEVSTEEMRLRRDAVQAAKTKRYWARAFAIAWILMTAVWIVKIIASPE